MISIDICSEECIRNKCNKSEMVQVKGEDRNCKMLPVKNQMVTSLH